MKYRNKKTKAVITTNCAVKGGDWELVEGKSKGKKSQKTEAPENPEEDKGEE